MMFLYYAETGALHIFTLFSPTLVRVYLTPDPATMNFTRNILRRLRDIVEPRRLLDLCANNSKTTIYYTETYNKKKQTIRNVLLTHRRLLGSATETWPRCFLHFSRRRYLQR